MFGIFAISVRPHVHARLDDGVAPARLGGLGGHGLPVSRRRDGRLLGGSARQPDATAVGADQTATRDGRPAATWRARRSASASPTRRSSRRSTTDASCGAVNGWHDSFTPLGGLVPLANIQLGEVVFGGVGAGMYGVLVYIILSVFIAGLMVGRTPEYLGKKIQAFEVQMAMLTVLIFSLVILTFTAISVVSPGFGTSSISNPGPHGLSEILYALLIGAANNGSAFGGLSANTDVVQHDARPRDALRPVLHDHPAAGDRRQPEPQEARPRSRLGTFPVTTPLFATLLVSVIVIVGALTFFPALSLGPIVEHFLMNSGQVF